MNRTSPRLMDDFKLIEAAALKGERCPQSAPHGPLARVSIGQMIKKGWIRSEVYRHNWRVVQLLKGENKGKRTKECPTGGTPYRVNGALVKDARYGGP